MSPHITSFLLIHTTISLYVHSSSNEIMCFSTTLQEKPTDAFFPEEFKLSDEFEGNCDYIDINSRKELTSKY